MEDEKLIAQQARRIAELEEELWQKKENDRKILREIYCVGGPLNDNRLGYTSEQLAIFSRIAECLEEA